ncbi:hypothetical protein GGR52DRAFT_251720 [Hypoxylon sp. FL1284]|nr:hypothetical protein GGR52DRAFT_251720 [Hypoxylon sp. FL1284]
MGHSFQILYSQPLCNTCFLSAILILHTHLKVLGIYGDELLRQRCRLGYGRQLMASELDHEDWGNTTYTTTLVIRSEWPRSTDARWLMETAHGFGGGKMAGDASYSAAPGSGVRVEIFNHMCHPAQSARRRKQMDVFRNLNLRPACSRVRDRRRRRWHDRPLSLARSYAEAAAAAAYIGILPSGPGLPGFGVRFGIHAHTTDGACMGERGGGRSCEIRPSPARSAARPSRPRDFAREVDSASLTPYQRTSRGRTPPGSDGRRQFSYREGNGLRGGPRDVTRPSCEVLPSPDVARFPKRTTARLERSAVRGEARINGRIQLR